MRRHRLGLLALALLPTPLAAQVTEGWYVFGTFSGQPGPLGLYTAHPRTSATPTAITGLQGDLTLTGSSCVAYRAHDGALLVGERAPTGSSVDLHAIWLEGHSVRFDASFSVGTGGPCCGEIPQIAVLPDDRVVVVATDLAAGPLQMYLTTNYGWQGVGIVDTSSGLITPIDISNGAQIVDVFNGLAVDPTATDVYLGTYVSGAQGDIWRVPLAGGQAVLVASVPAGLSNLAFDCDGDLWVTTLDANQGLFRVDVATGSVTQVPQTNGSLNGITSELATGNLAVVSANRGVPARSVFWMDRSGGHTLLGSTTYGTTSGVAVVPNPAVFGDDTPGTASYAWRLPNPGGLPLRGSPGFGLTIDATGSAQLGVAAIASARLADPMPLLGAQVFLDPTAILASVMLPPSATSTLALPIPPAHSAVGVRLFVQTFHLESLSSLSASAPIALTVL